MKEPERNHSNCKPWIIRGEFADVVGCDCPVAAKSHTALCIMVSAEIQGVYAEEYCRANCAGSKITT